MAVSKNFKNGCLSPCGEATGGLSPTGRATGPFCNFLFTDKSLEENRRSRGACRPAHGRLGPVAHPTGDRGLLNGKHRY